MGSEQWKGRTIRVARNQQSSSQPQSLMGCRDTRTHTHTEAHTFILLGPRYLNICLQCPGWTDLLWSHGQKCSDSSSSSIAPSFFLLHSIFTTGLFALLPLAPLCDWPGVCADCGEEEMKDAERHIQDRGKRSLTTLTTPWLLKFQSWLCLITPLTSL